MAETLQQYLNYISEVLKNKVNSTTIITFTNNEIRKLWRDMTSTKLYEMYTVADQELYTLPTDCVFEMITENGILVGQSTQGSTNQSYQTYRYGGKDDYASDYVYYEGTSNLFGILPVPEVSNKPIHIRYQAKPTLFASSDTAVQFDITEDYIDLIRFRVMSRIAKTGNNPDIEMGNNYQMEADELEKQMRLRKARDKMKSNRRRVSYREGWSG